MYLWRIENLKAELRQDALPQREQFNYYFAQSILIAIAMIPLPDTNNYDVLSAVVSLLITMIGVVYLYRCNGSDHGLRFLERAISIGFVVSVRLLVLLGLPLLAVYIFIVDGVLEAASDTTLTDLVVFSLVEIFIFWRIGVHLRQVAAGSVA